jgi:RHS repeat-associated protein
VDFGLVTYQHNALGQRVVKNNGTNTLFAYDEAGPLIGEYDSIGTAIQETVFFNGAPVAVLQGTDIYEVHSDQLGTPRVITDAGTIIWRWESDPFGTAAPQEDPDGDLTLFTYNLRFPGQYYDNETGLHYNYFRTYDPSTGRYLESDPIGVDGGLNTYGYALQNPLSYVDFFGQSPFKIIKLCAKGFKTVKEVGFREAVRAIRRGEDVLAPSTKQARRAANSASDANRATRDLPHQEDYMRHYHPKPRTGGHVFYSIAAALTFSNYVPEECDDNCATDEAASILDFFNPLSAPQDIIDIYEMFKEE